MGTIHALDREGRLRVAAQVGFGPRAAAYLGDEPASEVSAACRCLRTRDRVFVDDCRREGPGTPGGGLVEVAGIRSLQCNPLAASSGLVVGVFSTYFRSAHCRPSAFDVLRFDSCADDAAEVIERFGRGGPIEGVPLGLVVFTRRERQVLDCLLSGKCIKEVAAELGISVNTARDYTKVIYRKARVHSSRELIVDQRADIALRERRLARVALTLMEHPWGGDLGQLLLEAASQCTGARHASLWEISEGVGERALVLRERSSGAELDAATVARRIPERGVAREAAPGSAVCRGLGLRGEVILVRLPRGSGCDLLLLSDPVGGDFGPGHVGAMRLLARLAETRLICARAPGSLEGNDQAS